MKQIEVSLVYISPDQQWLKETTVSRGSSVSDLIAASDVLTEVKELSGLEMEQLELGVYSQKVTLDTMLEEGDRVEIYRPLKADPKEVRRQLALLGKTMGKPRAG